MQMAKEMHITAEQEQELEAYLETIEAELQLADISLDRFKLVWFASRSRGKGRTEGILRERMLLSSNYGKPPYIEFDRAKWDELAQEYYQEDLDPNSYHGLDQKLQQQIIDHWRKDFR